MGFSLPRTLPLERPEWLDALLSLEFFVPCKRHFIAKKNERNIFCIDCHDAICQHCLGSHGGHKLVQVRQAVLPHLRNWGPEDCLRGGQFTKEAACKSGIWIASCVLSLVIALREPMSMMTIGAQSLRMTYTFFIDYLSKTGILEHPAVEDFEAFK